MTDPASAETYPQYCMADDDREREEALAANGFPKPLTPPLRNFMATLRAQRAAERLAAGTGSLVDAVAVAHAPKETA